MAAEAGAAATTRLATVPQSRQTGHRPMGWAGRAPHDEHSKKTDGAPPLDDDDLAAAATEGRFIGRTTDVVVITPLPADDGCGRTRPQARAGRRSDCILVPPRGSRASAAFREGQARKAQRNGVVIMII